jgi:hypothetical protein
VSSITEFLRARYTEARDKEAGRQSIPGNLPFQWTAVYNQDDPHVMLGEFHRVGMDEFFAQYGESAADPDVLADLDAKLRLVDWGEWPGGGPDARDAYEWAMAVLALPYAWHPDYDERWRP